ncbi:hypothetical protein L3073_00255 [Ancylomarina sp. DW003]|nr:hypothetical protein [Ancylomarina sp. DW003]MDE5420633.1 hypothetical protein [Ancylomarina sp. DW003]
MKTIKIFKLNSFFLFILIATQSCMVSSLHPLYTSTNLIHKEELNGKWQTNDGTKIEITTITDTTGLAEQSKNMQDISKIKHKVGTKLKVKYSKNRIDKDSVETETLSKEERFMMGLNKEKENGQSISSTKKNSDLSKEERFMMGLDQPKKGGNQNKIPSMKQMIYFMYPNTRKHYEIKLITKRDTSFFEGRLAKLDKYYFLDVIPHEDYLEQKLDNDNMISLVVPMHGFFKLNFIDKKLKLNWIYFEDFKKLRKNKKIRLARISRDDREIITAKTSNIQKFLIKFADSDLFNNKDAELILTPLK